MTTIWFTYDQIGHIGSHMVRMPSGTSVEFSQAELRSAGVPLGWKGGELSEVTSLQLWAIFEAREKEDEKDEPEKQGPIS